jgi:hypothetical protein
MSILTPPTGPPLTASDLRPVATCLAGKLRRDLLRCLKELAPPRVVALSAIREEWTLQHAELMFQSEGESRRLILDVGHNRCNLTTPTPARRARLRLRPPADPDLIGAYFSTLRDAEALQQDLMARHRKRKGVTDAEAPQADPKRRTGKRPPHWTRESADRELRHLLGWPPERADFPLDIFLTEAGLLKVRAHRAPGDHIGDATAWLVERFMAGNLKPHRLTCAVLAAELRVSEHTFGRRLSEADRRLHDALARRRRRP